MLVEAFARICLLVSLMAVVLGVSRPAFSERPVIKYVSVRQSLGNIALSENETSKWREMHLLECRRSTCTGRLPLVLEQKVYYYDAIATMLTEDDEYLQININLHPIVPGCGPRCQPNLTAIFTYLPLARQAHVTVPVKQYGNFNPSAPSDDLNDAVYQVLMEPVAYLDLSIEFR